MAARKNTPKLNPAWRERIRQGVILDRLMKHIEGEIEMTSTQVTAATVLLKKCLPDLQNVEVQNLDAGGNKADPAPFKIEILK